MLASRGGATSLDIMAIVVSAHPRHDRHHDEEYGEDHGIERKIGGEVEPPRR